MARSSSIAVAPGRAEIARRRLLDAGLDCFASRGLDGVSIREIARKARQNSAAIAYYFGSKEGLYQAVLSSVLTFVRSHSAPVTLEYAALLKTNSLTPAACERLLRQLQRDMFLGVFGGTEALKFALLITREQIQPTAAFTSLYNSGLEPIHRMLTHLLAVAVGEDPASHRAILRAHTHFGQLQIFVTARALALRRLQWKDFTGAHGGEVLSVLEENLDLLLAGLRAKTSGAPSRNRKTPSS